MKEQIHCGSGKIQTGKYGDWLKLSFNKDDIAILSENLSRGGWVNVDVFKLKEVGKKGQTHRLVVNVWEPDDTKAGPVDQPPVEEDLPF